MKFLNLINNSNYIVYPSFKQVKEAVYIAQKTINTQNHKAVVVFWNTNSGVITIGFNYENYRFSSFDKVLKFKWDNGFDFKSKLFSEGISDNNKNIEEDIENIIGFLYKKFLSKIIEK